MYKFLFFICMFFFVPSTHAHAPGTAEPSRVSCNAMDSFCQSAHIVSNDGINVMNSGYGYFGHPNEEELNSFEFGCSPNQRMQYMNVFCGPARPEGGSRDSTKVMLQLIRPMFENKVRKAFFEKLKLEADATGSALPEIPSCMKAEMEANVETAADRRIYQDRKRRTQEQFSTPTMVRALYATDRIEKFISANCNKKKMNAMCTSANQSLERIKMNFSMLFPPPTYNNGVKNYDPGASYRTNMRKALHQSIGALEKPTASVEDQIKAGEKFYQANLKADEIDGGIAFDNKMIAMSGALAANAALRRARDKLDKKVVETNKAYIKGSKERFHKCFYGMGLTCTISAAPERLCDKSVIHQAVGNYPNVVRQALAEMNVQEREGAKLLMCRWDLLKSYREYRCAGVKTSASSPRTVTVKKEQSSYPYVSEVGYTLVEGQPQNDIPHVIKTKIYVRNKSQKTDDEFRREMAAKSVAVSAWYTQQTQARNLEVQVEYVPTTNGSLEPSFNINTCYRAEIDSNDCDKVKKFTCDDSVCLNNAFCVQSCLKPAGDPIFNRENAANLTMNTSLGTHNHEVGHILGLDDEYQDDGVRLTDKSNDDFAQTPSVMQSSEVGTLRTRHINQLLMPLQCADQD